MSDIMARELKSGVSEEEMMESIDERRWRLNSQTIDPYKEHPVSHQVPYLKPDLSEPLSFNQTLNPGVPL